MITLNNHYFKNTRLLESNQLTQKAEIILISVIALHVIYSLGEELGENIFASTGYELLTIAPRFVIDFHFDVVKEIIVKANSIIKNRFIKTVFVGPLVEELFFRGLQLAIKRYIPMPVRIALISLSFSYSHLPAQPGRLLALFLGGAVLGILAEKKNLPFSIAAHSLYNLTSM